MVYLLAEELFREKNYSDSCCTVIGAQQSLYAPSIWAFVTDSTKSNLLSIVCIIYTADFVSFYDPRDIQNICIISFCLWGFEEDQMLSKLKLDNKIYTSRPSIVYLQQGLVAQTWKSKMHIVNNTFVKLCLADNLLTIDSAVLLIITCPVP